MTPTFWRRLSGPAVTLAAANVVLFAGPAFSFVPLIPGAIMIVAVLFSTLMGGVLSGLVSAAVSIVYGALLLSEPGHPWHLTSENLARIGLLTVFSVSIPIIVWRLRLRGRRLVSRERAVRERVEANNRDLSILRAALDKVDYGVLLLDETLRARFMNDAFMKLWGLDRSEIERRPAYTELVQRARKLGVEQFQQPAPDRYISQRIALVREGSETPVDLRLSSGAIVRVQCKVLPSGGRFLSYNDITDLVHQSEAFERLATTDDLTGAYNRRHFITLATEQFSRRQHAEQSLALLILDIDLFKSINDRFGHGVGDAVICHVADICREEKRDGDILARIGGEEFTLLQPDTTIERAEVVAERIRQRLDVLPVTVEGFSLPVTVSIGVAEADATMASLGELMRRADQALYDAKRTGRNQVKRAAKRPAAA